MAQSKANPFLLTLLITFQSKKLATEGVWGHDGREIFTVTGGHSTP